MTARTVMQAKRYGVYTCTAELTLLDAASKMVDEFISALVVVDADGYLIGLISRVDILRARLESAEWQSAQVGDYMSTNVTTIAPDAPLINVVAQLVEGHIHRVVVAIEEAGRKKPVSVISTADMLYHMTREARL